MPDCYFELSYSQSCWKPLLCWTVCVVAVCTCRGSCTARACCVVLNPCRMWCHIVASAVCRTCAIITVSSQNVHRLIAATGYCTRNITRFHISATVSCTWMLEDTNVCHVLLCVELNPTDAESSSALASYTRRLLTQKAAKNTLAHVNLNIACNNAVFLATLCTQTQRNGTHRLEKNRASCASHGGLF